MPEGAADIHFTPNDHFSIGVEIEFQVLDQETLNLAPLAPQLLENSPKILASRLTHEFIRSILELQTGICSNVRDVENDLMETCSMAMELAQDNGCLLYATSLHPFAKYSDQIVTQDPRYEHIMDELQIIGRKFISQGLHVHIGLPDGDTAVKTCNILQLYLPLLLALSTSSPYSNGEDTGLLSYRTKLFEVLPQAGIYDYYQDWRAFCVEVATLKEYNVISSLRDLWWDARINPEYGTIEVRICDLPGRFSDILAITSLVQALIAYISEERKDASPCSQQILRANKWQAVRHGLHGTFVDCSGVLASSSISMVQAVQILLDKVEPFSERLGGGEYLQMLKRILRCGTCAEYQRKI